METKKCFKCQKIKDLDQFYKHEKMVDGHLNKCIECTKSDVRKRENVLKNDPTWIENERVRGREKYHRLGYKGKNYPNTEKKRESMKRYNQKYPEKALARKYTEIYLTKLKGINLHHWSYNQEDWLDVIELDVKQHYKIHRYIIYDQETMYYKDLKGNLLDTKQKHLEYINQI